MICPNKNLQEWKDLVSVYGENKAYIAFIRNNNDIPDVNKAEELLFNNNIKTEIIEPNRQNIKNEKTSFIIVDKIKNRFDLVYDDSIKSFYENGKINPNFFDSNLGIEQFYPIIANQMNIPFSSALNEYLKNSFIEVSNEIKNYSKLIKDFIKNTTLFELNEDETVYQISYELGYKKPFIDDNFEQLKFVIENMKCR